MAALRLNIDPTTDDEFYRYKMPAIITKIEGNGNGIKTVLPNLHDVCKVLNRPEAIIHKFFSYELGAQSTYVKKDDKFLMMGQFTQARMQELVFEFIKRFVLCRKCRNPETEVFTNKKGAVLLHCNSCGSDTTVSPGEKTYGHFAEFYAKEKGKPKKGKEEEGAEESNEPPPAAQALPQPQPHAAQPHTPVEAPKEIEKETRPNPIPILAAAMHSGSTDTAVRRALELKTEYGLNEAYTVRLVFRACLIENGEKETDKPIHALESGAPVLKRFCDAPDLQKVIIRELELLFFERKALEKFPMALKALFEENVLTQEVLVEWATVPKIKTDVKEKEAVKTLREKAAPFIEWLQAS